MIARTICRILGVLFVIAGVIVIFRGEPGDQYHNLLHLGTGLVALAIGFGGSIAAASQFCVWFGVGYLTLGVLGMVVGDPLAGRLWHVGPLHLDSGDHGFHLVLGTIQLVGGLLTRRTVEASTT
jgi:hypothetical protein